MKWARDIFKFLLRSTGLQRFNDPTYIRYFFYFADETKKLIADHNRLATDLGCGQLTKEELENATSQIGKGEREPYQVLHSGPKVTCILHAVKDTIIWQVVHSAGKSVSDPKVGWEFGRKVAWGSVSGAYGVSELFVVNVKGGDLKKVAEKLYSVLQKVSPDLPPTPIGEEAVGTIGYLRWIGGNTFLLLVREGSEETKSADFQCGTFPRLMMQFHKARHYERLVAKSVESVIDVMRTRVLSDRHLPRFVDTSLTDIETMVKNIEVALVSYRDLVKDLVKEARLSGEVWNQLEKRIVAWLENAQHEKEKLETEKRLLDQRSEVDERIKALSEQLDKDLREQLLAIHRTLRQANNPVGALLQLYRASLRLMDLLFKTVGKSRPSDNLWACIVQAGKGDQEEKIQGLGILPDEMASLLHTIRTYANKADHDVEKVQLKVEDAEIALSAFLRVLDWFYCEYDKGPRLPSIYQKL